MRGPQDGASRCPAAKTCLAVLRGHPIGCMVTLKSGAAFDFGLAGGGVPGRAF